MLAGVDEEGTLSGRCHAPREEDEHTCMVVWHMRTSALSMMERLSESLRCGRRPTIAKGRIDMEDILKNKTAVVYGAGSIGGAVAAAFAQAGATVFVAAHHEDALNKLADKKIQTERVDVLDKDAVAAFVKSVVAKTGHVDISFCATSTHKPGGEQGAALTELSYEDFSLPIIDSTKATFNPANTVYPYMVKQHAGVIMGMPAE